MATLESLIFTIIFPLFSETTVTVPPTTNPKFSKKCLISSFPPTRLIKLHYPVFAIVNGMLTTPFPYIFLYILFLFFINKNTK